jgi:hypothetical protein
MATNWSLFFLKCLCFMCDKQRSKKKNKEMTEYFQDLSTTFCVKERVQILDYKIIRYCCLMFKMDLHLYQFFKTVNTEI